MEGGALRNALAAVARLPLLKFLCLHELQAQQSFREIGVHPNDNDSNFPQAPGARRSRILAAAVALAAACSLPAAANTFTITPMGTSAWTISVDGGPATSNPTLTLHTGQTYTFNVTASSFHPFWIKTLASTGSGNAYAGSGLSDNGVMSATTLTFDVPADAPATLFYNCGNHRGMTGTIEIVADLLFKDGFE